MTEPSKKVRKGKLVQEVAVDAAADGPSDDTTDGLLRFWTAHPEEACLVDLTPFARGRTVADAPAQHKNRWRGDFTGRPELLADISPLLRRMMMFYAARTVEYVMNGLRCWWRVLDEAEKSTDGRLVKRVRAVEDLTEFHYAISRKLKITNSNHGLFVRIVNIRLAQKGAPTLHWPSPGRNVRPSEMPTANEINTIRLALKRGWFAAIDRWDEADVNEPALFGWASGSFLERRGHVHSIYRALVNETGNPLPSGRETAAILGFSEHPLWVSLTQGMFGLYPSGFDVRCAFHLCLLQSGWNVQTLLALDAEGDLVQAHPTNPSYHIIRGTKRRGESEHLMVGRNRRSDSPGAILTTLLARTNALRVQLCNELTDVERRLAASHSDALKRRAIQLRIAKSSAWLFAEAKSGEIRWLTEQNMGSVSNGRSFLKAISEDHNSANVPAKHIRTNITAGDFRDAYIGFAYESSNYNVLAAQTAAVHRSANTTQIYLRHRTWKAHSAKAVRAMANGVWSEIVENRVLDPAILRARVEHGEVTVEQRRRLEEHRRHRTRVGVECKDFYHPPPEISPEHVMGSGCRVQRCTLCSHAIVTSESLNHLARRQAELESIRESIPVPSWVSSNFLEELKNTEGILSKFSLELVTARLAYWRKLTPEVDS